MTIVEEIQNAVAVFDSNSLEHLRLKTTEEGVRWDVRGDVSGKSITIGLY